MSAIDIVLIAVITIVIAGAVALTVKRKRHGGCCGDCSGCDLCPKEDKEERK